MLAVIVAVLHPILAVVIEAPARHSFGLLGSLRRRFRLVPSRFAILVLVVKTLDNAKTVMKMLISENTAPVLLALYAVMVVPRTLVRIGSVVEKKRTVTVVLEDPSSG